MRSAEVKTVVAWRAKPSKPICRIRECSRESWIGLPEVVGDGLGARLRRRARTPAEPGRAAVDGAERVTKCVSAHLETS